jgi:MATE family multidrug resistance protein
MISTLHSYTRDFQAHLRLAFPVILGMLGHTFVAFADNVMVGQLGAAELAAVSLGNSFVFIGMSLGIGFSVAITPLVAEADGEGANSKAKNAFKHGLILCTTLGVLLFLMIWLAKPMLYHMDQPEEVVELAKPYLDLVAFSLIPLVIFQAFKQFSEGMSQTKYPMYATLLANVVNILLNYILIFGKWGAPQLGVVGAAIGTLVSRVLMLLFLWGVLWLQPRLKPFVSGFQFSRTRKVYFKKILSLGFPTAMQMFFEVAIFTAAIWMSGVLGKNAQAANQIALNLSSMTFMVGMGLSAAAMIRVGNQKGLQNWSELRRLAHSLFFLTLLIEIVFAMGFWLGADYLPTIYLDENNPALQADNGEVILRASRLLVLAAVFQISDGLQVVVLGALRGLQDVWIPTLITLIAYWVIGFPISYYLGIFTDLEGRGIWVGLLAGLTASALMLYLRFRYLTNKLLLDPSANH